MVLSICPCTCNHISTSYITYVLIVANIRPYGYYHMSLLLAICVLTILTVCPCTYNCMSWFS